ncbi:MAG: EscU/YscU/HrcU family type III secretion system export apparatus switch protein [Gammaproteobacteria bacterium]|jgi:flagellar biosynthesis protein
MTDNFGDRAQRTVVALQYDGAGAPRVTAKGTGLTGEQILALAREHGIPLHENGDLAEALSHIPLGEEIPAKVFAIVAEILAYIYYLDDMQSRKQT